MENDIKEYIKEVAVNVFVELEKYNVIKVDNELTPHDIEIILDYFLNESLKKVDVEYEEECEVYEREITEEDLKRIFNV